MERLSIPIYSAPFVGRKQELDAIKSLFADPNCRLLTLTGLGGIGKTRLAVQATAHIFTDPRTTTLFIPLQKLTSSSFLVTAIAEAVGIHLQSGIDPKPQLLEFLRNKSYFLILDNMEHLLDSAELLSELLNQSAHIKLLVTSRERLGLLEEWVFEVSNLSLPILENFQQAEDYDASALFIQSARRARADLPLTADDQRAIVRVCQLVGGIPLALELAAAWVRVLNYSQIAAEIEHSLDILQAPLRNTESRHRDIRAVFEPTWNMLSDNERWAFQMISVFRGGFTREAASYIAGANLPLLMSLIDKSLLYVDTKGRYTIHELLRQYAYEKLSLTPEQTRLAKDVHAQYFANFLHEQWRHLTYRRQQEAITAITADIENVRAAWRHNVQEGNAGAFAKSVNSLWLIYDLMGWYAQGIELFSWTVETLRLLPHNDELAPIVAQTQAILGFWLGAVGLPNKGLPLSEAAWLILKETDNREAQVQAINAILYNTVQVHDSTIQVDGIQEILASLQATGDSWCAASAQTIAASISMSTGDPQTNALLEKSVDLWEEARNYWGMSWGYYQLALMALRSNDLQKAQAHYQNSLHAADAIDYRAGQYRGHYFLGVIAAVRKNWAQAEQSLRTSLRIAFDAGLQFEIVQTVYQFARLQINSGNRKLGFQHLMLVSRFPTFPFIKQELAEFLDQHQEEAAGSGNTGMKNQHDSAEIEAVIQFYLNTQDSNADGYVMGHETANRLLAEPLSERELEVLKLIASGLSNQEIANHLVVGLSTVKTHINHLYDKLNVTTRTQALVRAAELNLI